MALAKHDLPVLPFEEDASAALQRLRNAIAAVVDALPEPATKAADLHRKLKVDMVLSWKLFKVIGASSPLAAGPHVPSPAKIQAFLRKASGAGVSQSVVDAVTEASREFERMVDNHSGDRMTFDSMVSALVDSDDAAKIYLQHKRAAFRAQRQILGVQARTQLRCVAVQPSTINPQSIAFAIVGGFVDLRLARSDVRVPVARTGSWKDDGTTRPPDQAIPLDPDSNATDGLAMIRRFCSTPLPEIAPVHCGAGETQYELVCQNVGKQAAVTYVQGHWFPERDSRYRSTDNSRSVIWISARTPCEVLVYDLLIHRKTYDNFSPTVVVFSEHLGALGGDAPDDDRNRLRIDENISFLGRGPSALRTADVPRYVELGQYMFEQTGWDPEAFDLYRCRIEYPVVPSAIEIRYDLPDPPCE